MELDKRIIPGKRPLIRLDAEQAKEFIGKECYFSDVLDDFEDLDEFKDKIIVDGCYVYLYKGKLNGVFANDGRFIVGKNDISYRFDYCLPCEWVREEKKEKKEPKYRPYNDAQEFFNDIGCSVGDVIHYRRKSDNTRYRSIIAGTSRERDGEELVCFCNGWYTMEELFDLYEVFTSGDWQPFGILEEYQP